MVHEKVEIRGLEEMRGMTEEFLRKNDKEPLIKQFLKDVDDETMLQFLRGRKYRPAYAWETLKRYAEVKLVKFTEFFPEELPPSIAALRESYILTVLKHRDSLGRRILIFDTAYWNVDEHSLWDLASFGNPVYEKLIRDKDAMENGLVVIGQANSLGVKHCLQFSLKAIKKLLTVFWHAFPVRYKAVYYVNTPYMLSCTLAIARVFFPKKLKERVSQLEIMLQISSDDGALYQVFSPDILPKCVGGNLEIEEAIDPEMTVW